jgi:magnesium-transporting ATPase (P-type)
MSINEIANEYINLLWRAFQSDLDILSNWWMWAALLIPAVLYILFMVVKWTILLFPIWMPLNLLRIPFRRKPSYVSTGNFIEDMINIRAKASERIKKENPRKPVAYISDNGK